MNKYQVRRFFGLKEQFYGPFDGNKYRRYTKLYITQECAVFADTSAEALQEAIKVMDLTLAPEFKDRSAAYNVKCVGMNMDPECLNDKPWGWTPNEVATGVTR